MSGIVCETCGNEENFMSDTRNGELVCKRCGLVVSDDLSFEEIPLGSYSEITGRHEQTGHGAYRTGLIHDYGMSTMVGQFMDLGRMTQEQRQKFIRLRKWQTRTRSTGSRDRNLQLALSFLSAICREISIPRTVQEYASKVYRQAFEANLIRGRSISHMSAASLYFACRKHEITRTIRNIAETNALSSETDTVRECTLWIARDYRLLLKELELKVPLQKGEDFVTKTCTALGLSSEVEQKAVALLEEYRARKFSAGKGPQGLAAAATYIACVMCGEKRTQKMIAKELHVTEVTIRNRYKGMVKDLGIDVKSKPHRTPEFPEPEPKIPER